ncbi:mitochondrial inner membrane protease subunit 2 [Exaiptasia diaphana]|uniref:Mitochondrial inner membrane protease subunit 2 n=1 Tax=Exaiptasia diaphana TaxID=2652724 RepID=A0A913XM14_EXADI|nr:mitochondrial inner membrane protease subunit 2 [Exaiptasia diaphana]KXJ20170.1 Mitochondrial inner membrane protease subunit 2 [Exaiptasia diaphana]
MMNWVKFVKTFSKGFIVSVPISIAIYDNIGSVSVIQGSSMKPCLNPDYRYRDIVTIRRIGPGSYTRIHRGDVVSLLDPEDPSRTIIKRVIGLQGDTIKTLGYKNKYVKIPKGHCWVEGDNHKTSFDSNTFGPVAVGLIYGKASHIVWPIRRWSSIQTLPPDNRVPLSKKECEEIERIESLPTTQNESPIESNDYNFTDYETMDDCGLLPGKFGPVS